MTETKDKTPARTYAEIQQEILQEQDKLRTVPEPSFDEQIVIIKRIQKLLSERKAVVDAQ